MNIKTYANNDEVETSPHAGEVSEESEGDPLEEHLDGEENSKHEVNDFQDKLEFLVVLQVDILEAQR